MLYRRLILSLIAGVALGSLFFLQTPMARANLQTQEDIPNHFKVLKSNTASDKRPSKPLTLFEAWDIAYAYAQNWSQDAELLQLSSSDARDKDVAKLITIDGNNAIAGHDPVEFQNDVRYRGLKVGQDGKRKAWLAMFQSAKVGKQLFLEITDNDVTSAVEDGIYVLDALVLKKPIIDSPEALSKALQAKPNLRMQMGKGRGFDFILQSNIEGATELIVVGSIRDKDTLRPFFVSIDPMTGVVTFVQ